MAMLLRRNMQALAKLEVSLLSSPALPVGLVSLGSGIQTRTFAKKVTKGPKRAKGAIPLPDLEAKTVPVSIQKDGQDPPLLPFDEYPDWLWKLTDPMPSTAEIRTQIASYEAKGENPAEHIDLALFKRLKKLDRKKKMKMNNSS